MIINMGNNQWSLPHNIHASGLQCGRLILGGAKGDHEVLEALSAYFLTICNFNIWIYFI